jgi:ubiquinone/menaquinone biosynthesis C-methylase UbiE
LGAVTPVRNTARGAAELKRAALDQWTDDPCGSNLAEGEPGSETYFETLRRARFEYAAWMREELGYAETAGLRVLDVGCGQGIDLHEYAAAGARVTGLDLAPRHVELARAHLAVDGLDGQVVEGDAEALPFPDASFDRVSSNGVLHHTPDIEAALREIVRVLRPGGEARIIVYNKHSFHYWLTQVLWYGVVRGLLWKERSMIGVMSRHVEYSRGNPRPLVQVFSRRHVAHLMRRAGFMGVETHTRHFKPQDTPPTWVLHKLGFRVFDRPSISDRIGRIGGWYVVGRGFTPTA